MDKETKRYLTIAGLFLLVSSLIGTVVWVWWARRKIEELRAKSATAEEKIKTNLEQAQIQDHQENIETAKQSQIETQQELDKLDSQIKDIQSKYEERLKKINEALTWKDLDSI